MTALNTFKALVGTDWVKAKRGIYPPGQHNQPEKTVCPHCKLPRSKKKPIVDLTQYGFEWDQHVTVFRCKCGNYFFAEYNIWHVGEETK